MQKKRFYFKYTTYAERTAIEKAAQQRAGQTFILPELPLSINDDFTKATILHAVANRIFQTGN